MQSAGFSSHFGIISKKIVHFQEKWSTFPIRCFWTALPLPGYQISILARPFFSFKPGITKPKASFKWLGLGAHGRQLENIKDIKGQYMVKASKNKGYHGCIYMLHSVQEWGAPWVYSFCFCWYSSLNMGQTTGFSTLFMIQFLFVLRCSNGASANP